jgi:GntR family transcriptional repressor for pyruvate dehydrogenase complex
MAVTDEAILQIKEMILSGELKPGDRLPPEKLLSESLGLSRSSMREAVKALEVIRVLDVRRGDGTYVTSLEPRLLLEAMSFVIDLQDDSSILELFAVRRILEPAAVALAAAHVTASDIADLRTQLAAVDESSSVEDLVAHDLNFHGLIASAAGNAYLTSLIDSLSSRTVRARIWRGLTQENSVPRTLGEHHAIVDALERGDAALARALTIVHISGVEQWLTDAVHALSAPESLGLDVSRAVKSSPTEELAAAPVR